MNSRRLLHPSWLGIAALCATWLACKPPSGTSLDHTSDPAPGAEDAGTRDANATVPGDGSADAALPDGPISQFDACLRYVNAVYDRVYRSCAGLEPLGDAWQLQDRCPYALFADGTGQTVESALACAKTWASFPCDQAVHGYRPDCASMGVRESGEHCDAHMQCSSGVCTDTGPRGCGTCAYLAGADERCGGDLQCVQGYRCQSQRCVPMEPSDPPLYSLVQGQRCEPPGTYACHPGLSCVVDPEDTDLSDGAVYLCMPLPRAGEPCVHRFVETEEMLCAAGAYCGDDQRCHDKAREGEPCDVSLFSSTIPCADDLYCPSTGPQLCKAREPLAASCDPERDSCVGDADCECDPSAAQCNASAYHCVQERRTGESCGEPGTRCRRTDRCDGGVCVRDPEAAMEECGNARSTPRAGSKVR
jgi:hypothetical protein